MWSNFKLRHESHSSAFEALCCQLFERWCRKQFEGQIRSFYFVDGRGGDGGVEAFAVLEDESVIGLQAKAFWDGFKKPQKTQVEKSIRSAVARHSSLTKYIVCFPLDPSESRGKGNRGKSELDHWREFESESKDLYPGVDLKHRGETKIKEWLQQPESETIAAYWFDKKVIPRSHWHDQFETTRKAWLDIRYVPDLHISTILDEELAWYANSHDVIEELKQEITDLTDSLGNRGERFNSLRHLPECPDEDSLSHCDTLVSEINKFLKYLCQLKAAAESQYLPVIEGDFSINDDVWIAADLLSQVLEKNDKRSTGYTSTHRVLKSIEPLLDDFRSTRDLLESQQSLLKMKIVFGDAGTGKTQSITKLCETSSDDGIPVLVIPARAHDPTSGWDEILGRATGRTGWSAPEILDALEASALFAWRDKPGPGIPPRRTILAVDGPDESPHPDAWAERLIELGDLCHSRHLIAPIVMTRPESLDWMPQESDQLTYLYPPAPDLTDKLPEIFREYARTFDITVQSPEAVAWALRTPLAIRTFADVYGGKKVAAGQDFMTTLSGLFKVKLERLDEEIHKKRSSWPSGKQLALRILTELVPDFLASGNCSYERFSQCLSRSLTHLGVAIDGAAEAFEKATKAHAILEFQIIPAEGMAPDEIKVRPSFSAILDYLLAYRIADKLRSIENSGTVDNSAEGVFPSILQGRQNAQAIVVSMLLKDGFSILESGLWNSVVEQKYLEKFHTKAICDLNSRQADIHRDWVSNILIRDMESCRMVVAELILPSARVPSAIFGAEFIHEEFDKLSLDQRDLVWSGPDLLPQNCGGCWEGYGIPVHDSINLRNDDSSSSLPILAAWATSSVDSRRQKRAIAELAQWGSKCPGEFAKLLLKFSAVNDIQVVESIMIAGTGAALEFRKHGEADKLAKVAHTMFFSNREAQPLRSVVARHAARLIIERAFKIGTNLACQVKSDATPPYETVGNRLRVDAEAASEARTSFFLDIYLESHVAEKATQPFFDYYRSYGSLEFSEEAATLLSDYREELSLGEPLKPKQLRNGLIVFQVKNWGWTRETFVGEPNGDKAGEQIGPDIAIMRLHERARHGARSTVSMFQEKYIWSAVNVVSAFLCDRLPGRFDFGSPFEPILNQSGLGSEMPDPLIGKSSETLLEYRELWQTEDIAPKIKITEERQPARGIEWMNSVDWPKPETWLGFDDGSVLLEGFLSSTQHDEGIQVATWVSCLAISHEHLQLVEEHIRSSPETWVGRRLHEVVGGFGGEFYAPMKIAVWVPWSEDHQSEQWEILSENGELTTINATSLVTHSYWEGSEGETSAWSPSKLLRDAAGVIDCVGHETSLSFIDQNQEEIAYFQRVPFGEWNKSNQYLKIRRSSFFDTLKENDLIPIWGVKIYRELIPELRPNGAWVDHEAHWVVIPKQNNSQLVSLRYFEKRTNEAESGI